MPEGAPGAGIGHFLGAFRVDAFRPEAEFRQHMDQWIRRFRQTEPVDPAQPVLIPGDPEREAEAERRATGIPLHEAVVEDLAAVAEKIKVSFIF
jgi:LDH2 family malate/lactate/ureidoglycolate dehydrogenase